MCILFLFLKREKDPPHLNLSPQGEGGDEGGTGARNKIKKRG
jgi:hypothetical protein